MRVVAIFASVRLDARTRSKATAFVLVLPDPRIFCGIATRSPQNSPQWGKQEEIPD
jgi:hypothetical protein